MTQTNHDYAPLPAPDTPPGELVPASNRDRPINLDFETYRPVRPLVGKVRGENLLWHSMMHAGCLETWDDPLHALQRHFGRDRMVWSMRLAPGDVPQAWELRVLNQGLDAQHAQGVLARIRELLAPWLELAPGLDLTGTAYDALALHLGPSLGEISVELRVRRAGELPVFDVHRCSADARAPAAKELVCEPKRGVDGYLPFLEAVVAARFDGQSRLLGRILIPELFACRRLHLVVRDGARLRVCFSGVNVEQLQFTYKRFEFPPPMLEFLGAQQARLEHLLWDVEVELDADAQQRVTYPNVAVYGSL